MAGKVYLGGGGDASDEADLWCEMLLNGRRVAYWPFALEEHRVSEATAWLLRSLDDLGLDVPVETWTTLEGRSQAELEGVDLIFVGGGNTFRLLDQVRSHGFADSVRQFVQAGGAYYGGSAGAILACDDVRVATLLDSNDIGLTDLTALGLVPNLAVMPHFSRDRLAEAQAWSRAHDTVVLGIPEQSGVVWSGSLLHVRGSKPVQELRPSRAVVHYPGDTWTPVPA